jgi:hypothetical protein
MFQSEIVEPTDPIDLIDPLAPIDVPRDIAVSRKILAWARQTLKRRKKDMHLLIVPSEREIYLRYIHAMPQL